MRRGRQPASPPSPDTLRTAAFRLLGRRDLTRAELTTRLVQRGYTADDVRTVVDRLALDGYVDDRRTALAHVRTASRIKGRGRLRIQRELEARGVGRDLIREVLSDLGANDDLAAIRRFLSKRRLPADPSPADRRRLFQQLLRRGFPPSAIQKVLMAAEDDAEG